MRKSLLTVAAAIMLVAASCSHKGGEQWTLEGTIDGAGGREAVVQRADARGVWVPVDTVVIASDGTFTVGIPRQAHPEIYRLSIDGRSAYLPADSTETVTIRGSIADFDRHAVIGGSDNAHQMQLINDMVIAVADASGDSSIASDSILKRNVAKEMSLDWGSIAAYYALHKSVGNTPLFDPINAFDRMIYGAVATAFKMSHPDDPRTAMLENYAIEFQNRYRQATATAYVEETPVIDITLPDVRGEKRSLVDVWNNSKVVILNFTANGMEDAPALNLALGEVYNRYHERGLEIYQVGCDDDEYVWRNTARNLPWVTVYGGDSDAGSRAITDYMVRWLPYTYVINSDASRFERVNDLSQLDKVVASML